MGCDMAIELAYRSCILRTMRQPCVRKPRGSWPGCPGKQQLQSRQSGKLEPGVDPGVLHDEG